jgi:hypothetical protein
MQTREEFIRANKDVMSKWTFPIFQITGATTVMDVPFFQVTSLNRYPVLFCHFVGMRGLFFQAQGTLALNMYDANNDMQLTQVLSWCIL